MVQGLDKEYKIYVEHAQGVSHGREWYYEVCV